MKNLHAPNFVRNNNRHMVVIEDTLNYSTNNLCYSRLIMLILLRNYRDHAIFMRDVDPILYLIDLFLF